MGPIREFQNEYRFLSNFYYAETAYGGITWPTAEHAYQAAKILDPAERGVIMSCPTPGAAKRAGKKITLREDWREIHLEVMYQVVLDKFSRNEGLKELLLKTGDQELREGNRWGDTYWGTTMSGAGHDHLGRILMRVRKELDSQAQ